MIQRSGWKIQRLCIETLLMSETFDIRYLLRNDRYDELKKLHELLEMARNGLDHYQKEFMGWIEMLMDQLKKQANDPEFIINCIIALEIHCQSIICQCLSNSPLFRQAVHNYFRAIANNTPFPMPLRLMILELIRSVVAEASPTEMKIVTVQRMIKV